PAVALRWLRLNPGAAIAPMHFPTLVATSDLPADVRAIVDDLLARKAVTSELGAGPLPAAIGRLIDEEFAVARETWLDEAWRPEAEVLAAADEFFRRWVTDGTTRNGTRAASPRPGSHRLARVISGA